MNPPEPESSQTLPAPHHHTLNAVVGWLELGNPREAAAELNHLPVGWWEHPEVLPVRWQLNAARGEWELAVAAAQKLTEVAPTTAWGWVHWAFALHELKRTQAAWDVLFPVVGRFPEDFLMRYNLACYACQLGQLAVAWDWLQRAVTRAGRDLIKQMARDDEDLQPLWARLDEL